MHPKKNRRCPEGIEIYPYDDRESAPVGSWVQLPYPDLRGQPLAKVMLVDPATLYLPELTEDGRLQPEKRRYLAEYMGLLEQGSTPPLVDALEMEDGRIRVTDGHRRALARIQVGGDLRILMSPLIAVGRKKYPLTLELLQANVRQKQLDEQAVERGPSQTKLSGIKP